MAAETKEIIKTDSSPRPSALKSIFLLSTAVLVLTLAGSVWMFLEGTHGIRDLIRAHELGAPRALNPAAEGDAIVLTRVIDAWLHQVALGTASGAVGLVIVVGIGFLWWRHYWSKRIVAARRAISEEARRHRHTANELSRRSAELKRLQADLIELRDTFDARVHERTTSLAASTARLEQELNSRRFAERILAEQTKELERSKDVLELHVQARTVELQKLQQLYESILNSAGEGIYGLDMEGRTTFVNLAAARLTCCTVEELIGKHESEAFRPPSEDEEPDGAADNAAPDVIFQRKGGGTFPVEYVRTPIEENGLQVGEVVIFKDITERKRAEEAINRKATELARSNAELEQFAYVASHDLQEPLRKIQAFGDRLKVKCDTALPAEGRDYLERMQSASARMQNLINDLLTFSRVISASRPFVPVNLGAVVREALNDLELRIEQTKAVVEVGSLPTIDADPLQLRQLVLNLVANALKFQPPGQAPVVRINAQIRRNNVAPGLESHFSEQLCELTIQDNGIGFDEKYLEKIFVVFQRLHGRERYEGTGVGLAVCRRITDRHGGSITARSKPGEGATFIVTLPVRHLAQEVAP